MTNRILICGLPNSAKTTFAQALIYEYSSRNLPYLWLNGDNIRAKYNDWDFTIEGRERQTTRMKSLSMHEQDRDVIIDYVCPLERFRQIIDPTHLVYISTNSSTPYADTMQLFEKVDNYTMIVTSKDAIRQKARELFSTLKY